MSNDLNKIHNKLVEIAPILIFAVDNDLRYTYINPFFAETHNISQQQAIGLHISDVIGQDGFNQNQQHYKAVLNGAFVNYESYFIKVDDNPHHYRATYKPLHLNEETQGFIGVVVDITAEKELERLSKTDSLTGLNNRREFEEHLKSLLVNSSIHSNGMLFLDIDLFKSINDTFGHDIGDQALIELGGLLKNCIDLSSTSYRIGGEEFAVLLPDISEAKELLKVANSIRKNVESTQLISQKSITVSIGAILFNHGDSRTNILKRVDIALYVAKNNGRNQVQLAK